jgi:hypothetical protein
LSDSGLRRVTAFPARQPPFRPVEKQVETRGNTPGRNIEQDTSQGCLKSEYLTLLNSFSVVENCVREAPSAAGVIFPHQPPKAFNEKELYGR